MDFAQVEAEFGRLKAQFERGALTEEAFKAQLEELMIEDEQGRWWILGYETGRWYVHDGEQWVQQEPPRAAPGPSAARPRYPGATEVIPDAQPAPAATAPSRPTLGQRLGRDGVSVLLIAVGWLVCLGGAMLNLLEWHILFRGSSLGAWALAGCLGGLVTSLVLRRTKLPSPWRQASVVTIGWVIGVAITLSELYRLPWMIKGAIIGLVGGLITALALKWTQPSIQWKHVALVTLGWGIGWAVGGAIGSSCGSMIGYTDTRRMIFAQVLGYALWGGVSGAIGSWVMFRQLREATQSSP